MLSAAELRKKYLDFFKEKGHAIIPSASLIPENDPTVLFTTAGMHPLVPYLLGEKHPEGTLLANVQKCIRTGDIEEVGDDTHLTFFEMLGNWSLGDYFKKEAIAWSFEFLTSRKWLGIPLEKLAVSVFAGDKDAPRDEESAKLWQTLDIPKERIAYLPKENNWWGPAGQTGPCGPDTEMFYWSGGGVAPKKFDTDNKQWVEIWNDVFMEYDKQANGSFKPLKQKNVDTGMGLDRVVAVLNGEKSPFETDLFLPILHKIEELSGKNYTDDPKTRWSMRVIADHLRTAAFILGDQRGVTPSNVDQGYVLRRLIRRSIMHGKKLGITQSFARDIGEIVAQEYTAAYPELGHNKKRIAEELQREEEKFNRTLEKGLREFERIVAKEKTVSGKAAFDLFTSHGFPFEVTQEMAKERGITVDAAGFQAEFKKHQELSRKGAEQKFAGGLANHSLEVVQLHTATHLLHRALKNVLGESIEQKGSNITAERLRFDFNYGEKIPAEKLKEIEDIVNEQIKKDLPVHFEELTEKEARACGAIGYFDDKYATFGNKLKVYFVGDEKRGFFSKEICGGPHVEHTGELGGFKILKEEAVSAGVRRIKAIVTANQKK
ncbi:MAG: alanine--tRNA ligase [Patescibacteria group bacterium]